MQIGKYDNSKGGWQFNDMTKLVPQFEIEQEDYLYDIEPQSNNLFFVANFSESTGNDSGSSLKEFTNVQFRARNVTLPSYNFTFNMDPITRIPVFDKGDFTFDVGIDWLDDVYHSVWKYHMDWLERWYSYNFNVVRCGYEGKFRKCQLVAYHYRKTANVFNPEVKAEPLYVIMLYGLVPTKLDSLNHSYDRDGGDELFKGSYKCSRFEIHFNNEATNRANNNMYDTGAKAIDEVLSSNDGLTVWNPAKSSSFNGMQADVGTLERARLVRTLTDRFGSQSLTTT